MRHMSFIVIIFSLWGLNSILWACIGVMRLSHQKFIKSKPTPLSISQSQVAILIPAHNEATVILKTIESLSPLISVSQIFVVSDGSLDDTANLARSTGAKVLELTDPHGKAGALQAGIKHFHLVEKYSAVLFVDADTLIDPNYLKKALPLFNDPEVVAVAGHATTLWEPEKLSWKNFLFIAHRERIWFITQRLIKYGQTWKRTNVTYIIPGFASIYRTSILNRININPPGLVIEDFNMTFEIHHKKLGKIAYHPAIIGKTQDPACLKDYRRQVSRWALGFWQTVKLHGFWMSLFSFNLFIYILETLSSSLILFAAFIFTLILLPGTLSSSLANIPLYSNIYSFVSPHITLYDIAITILVPDYVLTTVTAMAESRPRFYFYGLFFPLVRLLDAYAVLSTLPKALFVHSTGRWISPPRRQITTSKLQVASASVSG